MTDVDIRVFVCVGRQLNFSKAAQALYLSRQAVSRQIQKLEQQLGQQLFVRRTAGLTFTKEGKAYYDFFSQALGEFDELQRKLAQTDPSASVIQLGYVPGCAAALNQILSLVQSCQSRDHLRFNLVCCEPMDMDQMLKQGQLDVAINFDLLGDRGDTLQTLPFIASPRLLLVSHLNDKAFTAASYTEFQSEPLLGWRRSNESVEEAMVNLRKNSIQYGFTPNEIRILPNLESANTALRMNEGVALGTQFNTISNSPDIIAFPLEQSVELLLIWRKHESAEAVLQFIENVRAKKLPLLI